MWHIEYRCWITAMCKEYEKDLVTGLVNKEYAVRPSAASGKVANYKSDSPSCFFGIAVTFHGKEESNASTIGKHLDQVIKEFNMKIYSYIIFSAPIADSLYNTGNIILPPDTGPSEGND